MGRPGGLAGLERGWRTSRGAARRAPRATLGSVLIKFLLRAADYAAIASVPAGLKWKPGVEPGFFWSQVRSGSNSEVIVDFEDVRFDTESGTPRPPAPSSDATISPSDHFSLPHLARRRPGN